MITTPVTGLAAALLLFASPVDAAIKIVEVFPGTPVSPQAQYVLLQMSAAGQNLVAGKALTVHNAAGVEVARYTFAADVGNGASQAYVLIATPQAEQFFGLRADLEMTATLPAAGGKVCFGGDTDCVAWGVYSGSALGVGTPFNRNASWIVGGRAAVRRNDLFLAGVAGILEEADDTNNCANDFRFGYPGPINNSNIGPTVPASTCANGRLEGLEQCDDGNTINGDACNNSCNAAIPTAVGRRFADFNTDGRSDVPWRNTQTGANAIWRSAASTTPQPIAGVSNQDWRVVAVGDFDDSGTADIVWRNFTSGANVIWRGGNAAAAQTLPSVSLTWNIVGVGDFDADRRDDLIWRNSATGANVIWRRGNTLLPDSPLETARIPSQQWRIAGVADFNGDHRADLLWRNVATGANTIWRNGNSLDTSPVATAALAWNVAGIGDFDGDGQSDILWRNANTGANVIWRSAEHSALVAVASAGIAWRVVAIGDYDGDRRDDIVWRNSTTGANAIWRSGNLSTPQAMTGVTNQAWRVVP